MWFRITKWVGILNFHLSSPATPSPTPTSISMLTFFIQRTNEDKNVYPVVLPCLHSISDTRELVIHVPLFNQSKDLKADNRPSPSFSFLLSYFHFPIRQRSQNLGPPALFLVDLTPVTHSIDVDKEKRFVIFRLWTRGR